MGSLALPASGSVYGDAQIVIYTVEGHLTFSPPVEPSWQAAQGGQLSILSSELTILEFVTNDPVFLAVTGLNVVVLRDVLAAP